LAGYWVNSKNILPKWLYDCWGLLEKSKSKTHMPKNTTTKISMFIQNNCSAVIGFYAVIIFGLPLQGFEL
jgi:hypothetical protein